MKWILTGLMVFAIVLCGQTGHAKQFFYGIGTGFNATNVEGDLGLYSPVLGSTVQAFYKLEPDDFQELMSTAFGLGGFATDGTMMLTLQGGYMELAADGLGSLSTGGEFSSDVAYQITLIESHFGYTVYRSASKKFSAHPYAGFRFNRHKITNDLTAGTTETYIEHDNEWFDFLIGGSVAYAFTPQWSWSLSGDGGFGGSEGTVTGKTSITWKPLAHWSFSVNALTQAEEFENGTKGDKDWFLTDTDKTQFGLSFLYHF